MSETTQLEIRDNLITDLETDLVGPMQADELLPQRPSRWYLTGFLVPRDAPEEQRVDPMADERLGNAVQEDRDDDQGETDFTAGLRFFPASMGLSVIVPQSAGELQVKASWGEYTRLSAEESLSLLETHRAQREEGAPELEPPDTEPGDDADQGAPPHTTALPSIPSVSSWKLVNVLGGVQESAARR